MLKPLLARAAQLQFRAIIENHQMLVEVRVQLFDAIEIDDRRAMNTRKLFGIQSRFQFIHRLAQQVRFAADVHPHVVVISLDPINLLRANEERVAAVGHRELDYERERR